MPVINEYSFGHIIIDNREYRHDVIIYPDNIKSDWWRREGHRLDIGDIEEVLGYLPQEVVIGNGYNGVMAVPPETIEKFEQLGIKVTVTDSTEATRLFNEKQAQTRMVGLFHLTC